MNSALLDRLRSAEGRFFLLGDLGGHSVSADLDELERFGFVLERHPYLGVAYRGASPRLCPDQIEWNLGTKRVGRRIAVWNRVSSTNDLAVAASGSSANEGLVILAEEQERGRGRRGRAWIAPSGSCVLMSVLLFPAESIASPTWLTALGAVAAADVVADATRRDVRIKWPNDVRVEGRKIAGVLVERGAGSVIGIGLNADFDEQEMPENLRGVATSVKILIGLSVDRSDLARALIQRIDYYYDEGIRFGPSPMNRAWRERLEPIGRDMRLSTAEGEVTGRLIDASLDRGLLISRDTGESRWFAYPEILGIDGERFS